MQKNLSKIPLLSVVVPVYNTEKYLRKCINSILDQTYPNIELILVDDGSTDDSGMICDEYKKTNNKVIVIHTNNKGPLCARLTGVKKAKGEYITFVDSDDWICMNTYEKVMSLGKADVISFGIIRYFSKEYFYEDRRLQEGKYDRNMIEKMIIPRMLWNERIGTCGVDPSLCTKIFRKELIEKYLGKAGQLGIHYGDDIVVLYPLLLEADTLIHSRYCYYYHRQRPEGMAWPYYADEVYYDKVYKLYTYLRIEFQQNKYCIILLNQLDKYYRYSVSKKKNIYDNLILSKNEEVFPYWMVNTSSRVVLYGAGVLGKKYKEINDKYHFCNIILWVDQSSTLIDGSSRPQSVECIRNVDYDAVIIAVTNSFIAEEIRDILIHMEVSDDRIIWRSIAVSELK